jgi:hypothetical protein
MCSNMRARKAEATLPMSDLSRLRLWVMDALILAVSITATSPS